MSLTRMTLCGVMSHNDTDGFDYIVVVGWRTSRRRLRVRAKQLAKEMGVNRPYMYTFHTRKEVAVGFDTHLEVMA